MVSSSREINQRVHQTQLYNQPHRTIIIKQPQYFSVKFFYFFKKK